MLEPLSQWYCDVCGGVIEKPEDGYAVWGHDKDNFLLEGGFKIIHQGKCDKNDLPSSLDLPSFLGQEGLNTLLSFLSIGPIKGYLGQVRSRPGVRDFDEFVDFFRRVQVPYYEEARTKFGHPDLIEDFNDANEVYPYQVEVLKRIAGDYTQE